MNLRLAIITVLLVAFMAGCKNKSSESDDLSTDRNAERERTFAEAYSHVEAIKVELECFRDGVHLISPRCKSENGEKIASNIIIWITDGNDIADIFDAIGRNQHPKGTSCYRYRCIQEIKIGLYDKDRKYLGTIEGIDPIVTPCRPRVLGGSTTRKSVCFEYLIQDPRSVYNVLRKHIPLAEWKDKK